MRAKEIPKWQIDAAEEFAKRALKFTGETNVVTILFSDFVRALALYGHIRAKSVEAGCPADVPGHTYIVGEKEISD